MNLFRTFFESISAVNDTDTEPPASFCSEKQEVHANCGGSSGATAWENHYLPYFKQKRDEQKGRPKVVRIQPPDSQAHANSVVRFGTFAVARKGKQQFFFCHHQCEKHLSSVGNVTQITSQKRCRVPTASWPGSF